MRLREIKPGMVVHCKTKEEKRLLLEEAERLGYLWLSGRKPTEIEENGKTIHFYSPAPHAKFGRITWSDSSGNTEFSNLIIPELSAKEVLEIRNELSHNFVREYLRCGYGLTVDEMLRRATIEQVIDICEQWKENHEKKEPEVEWVNVCKILEVQGVIKKRVQEEEITGLDNTAPYSAVEEKAQEILKKYISEHDGNYIAVVERVCRVKK